MKSSQAGKIRIALKPSIHATPTMNPRTPASTKITETQSISVIKNMIRVSVSEICYLRNLFPEEVFKERVYADMHIKCLAPVEGSRDPVMRDAYCVTQWLEAGMFEAMDKKYLAQSVFCIYAVGKNKTPENLLESYTYKFKNSSEGSQLSTSFTGTHPVDSRPENVKSQAIQMIRNLVSITNTLEPLPKNRFVTMKMTYNDSCPSGWQPKYFKAVTDELGETFGKPTLKLDVGRMATPFHSISMKLEAAEDAFSTENGDVALGDVVEPLSEMNIDSIEPNLSNELNRSNTTDEDISTSQANPALPNTNTQSFQRDLRSPAVMKDSLIRFCVQFETVAPARVEEAFGLDSIMVKKYLDELCGDNVFVEGNNSEYRVCAHQSQFFYEAINLVHGKMRRHISVHTLAKCLSWSMYFAKSVLMRMHNEKLIDMEQEVAFDGYKVIIDEANRPLIRKAIQAVADKLSTTKTPKKIPLSTAPKKHSIAGCANMPILQSNQAAKKRRLLLNKVTATPVSIPR
ncbi:hypothetical protein LEN26_019245 [Aphanomyces euteiches]|nr:hypothetical protein LEN26_019245 [Aphanomyces euteiches]